MKCYMCNKELTTGDCGTKGLCNECTDKLYSSPVKNFGWECPKCGKVYAPFVSECNNCNQVKTYTTSTTAYCKPPYNGNGTSETNILNIKDEFAYIDDYFDHISAEQLYQELVDCGLQTCEHEWKHQYEQYFGGLKYVCKCIKCGSIKIE